MNNKVLLLTTKSDEKMRELLDIQYEIDDTNLKKFLVTCKLTLVVDIDTAEHAKRVTDLAIGIAMDPLTAGMQKDLKWEIVGAEEI